MRMQEVKVMPPPTLPTDTETDVSQKLYLIFLIGKFLGEAKFIFFNLHNSWQLIFGNGRKNYEISNLWQKCISRLCQKVRHKIIIII